MVNRTITVIIALNIIFFVFISLFPFDIVMIIMSNWAYTTRTSQQVQVLVCHQGERGEQRNVFIGARTKMVWFFLLLNSLGSPSTSLEAVGTPHGQQTPTPHQAHSIFTQLHAPRQWVDSEDEDEADWSSHVSAEILHTLSDTEKRRQEIINGNCIIK